MLKKIAAGYGKLFSNAAKIIVLAALCLGISFIIVYPLWKWSMAAPASYSLFILALLCGLLLYIVCRSVKKNGFQHVLFTLLKIAVVALGVVGCVFFVLRAQRLVALGCLVVTFVLYGILAFGIKGAKQKSVANSAAKNENQ